MGRSCAVLFVAVIAATVLPKIFVPPQGGRVPASSGTTRHKHHDAPALWRTVTPR
jgi:hypothetical protein